MIEQLADTWRWNDGACSRHLKSNDGASSRHVKIKW
jgi:hypothetical protein